MSNNKTWGCVSAVLFAVLVLSVFFNIILLVSHTALVAASSAASLRKLPEFGETLVDEGSNGSSYKIALITLKGLISSSVSGTVGDSMVEDVKIALRQAVDDEKVKAIVLAIDSPGGEVTASDVIYNAVRNARAKKPVVIYMGSLAASGGYYVSCGGSWLIASDTTITGSIGVIIETLNYEHLLGKLGLDSVVFKSGKFKDMLSGAREMTPEEKDYVQNMVMQTYGKFVQIVADERKLDVNVLRNGIADGRVLSGSDALKEKLINQLGQIEDAYAKARELGNAPGAEVVKYEPGFKLGKLFKMFGESNESKIEINLEQKLLPPIEPGKLYLLPGIYAQ